MGLDIKHEYSTGSGTLNFILNIPKLIQIESVRLILNDEQSVIDPIVIWLDSDEGSEYDMEFVNCELQFVQYFRWKPKEKVFIKGNDLFKIDWDNSDSLTYGLEVQYA